MKRKHRTILIVDDCLEDRETYRRYLLRDVNFEYTVLEAELGAEGLILWQQHQPDGMLLDYLLPDIDGLEFLTQLQVQKQSKYLPVVVVTGQGDESVAVQVMKAGASDYLIKKRMTAEELRLAINSAIEKAKLHAELQESEERLKLALEASAMGTWEWNIQTNYLICSDLVPSIFNLPDGICLSDYKNLLELVCIEDRETVNQAIVTAIQTRTKYQVEFRSLQLDGTVNWVEARGKVYYDTTGLPMRLIGTFMNISNSKEAQQEQQHLLKLEESARAEAEKANRIKDDFLAILSHELRSPLNPIIGWSTLLLKNNNLDATRITEALKVIERNAKLQAQLIEDLLDVSRIFRGKFNLEAKPVNLVNVISSALETVRLAAETKTISLKFLVLDSSVNSQLNSNFHQETIEIVNSATGLWNLESGIESQKYYVLGDAQRLQQIVWNLLSNAVKFTPKDGAVEVKLEPVGNLIQIVVTDTGKGISLEFLPHVFEYFRQADSGTTRQFGGLGLGLAIVHQLVELHGGTIQVESTGEGQGATFTVVLTRIKTKIDGNKAEFIANYSNLQDIQILVVDDDEDSLNFIKFVLEEDGAIVTAVPSALDALKILSDLKPDVLVSDIGMPGMDGYALMRQIRTWQLEAGGGIPAVALTAYAGEIDKRQALAVGFQTHLTKPVEPESLVTVIAELARCRVL
jgi:signal transduction histidine kinase/DNA-binding response OmpR family regulator